ncbi:MAG: hypothetical protein COT17_05270 [Elusimicrobia bacterium CG08_land_8_20_14_0_20_51_18]|nr:MAG: hypothetical protein COT17_05270 [Elusimicrobia bacterium CG08_land_8_20_14_0_20_51_18]
MKIITTGLVLLLTVASSFSQKQPEQPDMEQYNKMMEEARRMQEAGGAPSSGDFEVLIKRISGDVKIKNSGAEEYVTVEGTSYYPVDPDDTVKTGSTGYAELYFSNSGIIKVDRNTELEVKNLQQEDTSLVLNLGAIIGKFERVLGKKFSMKIHTPVAVCAIRGTEFAVEQSLFNKETTFGVFEEGQLGVTPSEEGNGAQEIQIGKGSELTLSPSIRRPKVIKISKLMKHRSGLAVLKKNMAAYKKRWQRLPREKRERLRNFLLKVKTSGGEGKGAGNKKNKVKKAVKKRAADKRKKNGRE